MTKSEKYRLSLHVSHPSYVAYEIMEHFSFRARYSKSVGDKRVTASGVDLGGTYSQTNITFDISGAVVTADDQSLEDCIIASLRSIPGQFIKELIRTGGECFFLVGTYVEDNFIVYFSSQLLTSLSDLSIGLKLDIYGGPE